MIRKKMLANQEVNGLSEHWSRNAIFYQIYPLSFKDANGDGKGDLAGIIEKLDYLKSLSIDAIWLSPFYRSPMADFGYDVSDFLDIDPVFGDIQTFEKLVSELHARGIKLILDYVGNHTSSEHPWFKESRSSLSNPKRDWYVWHDPKTDGSPPNNWMSVFGGSAWELDPTTGQYYLHSFLSAQPDLNWRNPEVRAEMMHVVDFWVEKGVDGFRIDALQHFVEDENLGDDSQNMHYNPEIDEPYKLLIHNKSLGNARSMKIVGRFINEALERHPDIFIVGEAYVGTNDLKKLYELSSEGRFAPFNFNLIGLEWKAAEWKRAIDDYQTMLLPGFIPNYVLGNHDVSRVATRVGEARARVAAVLQLTLPGIPFIYYGEELGMTNGVIPHEAIQDFLAKIFKGFHPGRDLERTPMQWDESTHAGFSTAKPWLPVADNYKKLNVANEANDQGSMFVLYKELIGLRKKWRVLQDGVYAPLKAGSPDIFSFKRVLGGKQLVILANFGETEVVENIKDSAKIILNTGLDRSGEEVHGGEIRLRGNEACVVEIK